MAIPDFLINLRKKIGNDLLVLPSAGVTLFNETGRVLLVQHTDRDIWTLPGGIIEPGESPADAALREVWEETGLLVELTSVFGVFGSFTYYLPELFPTRLRATGSGFCYNFGRFVAAIRRISELIGRTPPPAKYFGFYTFIATRFYPGKEEGTEILSTLGDAVNNATIKTTGPTPFDAPVALIFTSDQGTDAGIRAALRRAGYPEAIINTNVLPASMLNLGHGKTADEFQINLRTALFEDPDAGNRYIEDAPVLTETSLGRRTRS